MAYYEEDGGKEDVIPELPLIISTNGDYVKLRVGPEEEEYDAEHEIEGSLLCYWVKRVMLFLFIGLLAFVFFNWVGPYIMDKVCYCFCFCNCDYCR